MAHRQLAEKYAAQLNEANRRIRELEGAVADAEDRAEQTKTRIFTTGPKTNDNTEALQAELDAAKTEIEKLNAAASTEQAELETSKGQAQAKELSAQALTKSLEEQLKPARDAAAASGGSHNNRLGDDNVIPVSRVKELQRQLGNSGPEVGDLRRQVADLNQKLRRLGGEKGGQQVQINSLKKREEALKLKVADMRDDVATQPQSRRQRREADALAQQEIKKLTGSLDREKKRRLEAEAMLGPDGKRCKKCNPIIVDLE